MKKILAAVMAALSISAFAAETIKIQTPYTPSHSGTPAMLRIIDLSNQIVPGIITARDEPKSHRHKRTGDSPLCASNRREGPKHGRSSIYLRHHAS